MTWLTVRNIFVTNDYGYVLFVIITVRFFPHSLLITCILARVTLWVSLFSETGTANPSGSPEFADFFICLNGFTWLIYMSLRFSSIFVMSATISA